MQKSIRWSPNILERNEEWNEVPKTSQMSLTKVFSRFSFLSLVFPQPATETSLGLWKVIGSACVFSSLARVFGSRELTPRFSAVVLCKNKFNIFQVGNTWCCFFAYLVERKADWYDINTQFYRLCQTNQCYVIGGVPRILKIIFMHDDFFHINLWKKLMDKSYIITQVTWVRVSSSRQFLLNDHPLLTICVGSLQASSPSRTSQSHLVPRVCSPSATTSGLRSPMQWAAVRT